MMSNSQVQVVIICPMQLVSDPHSVAIMPCETGLATSNSDRIMEMFESFIQNGFVSLSDGIIIR